MSECCIEFLVEADGPTGFVVFDGKRIAQRGRPGTPQAGKWVSLEPGYVVYSNADHITVEYNGVVVQ